MAFTLAEVLVVLAIILVMVALITPALSSALARSRLTQCTNNQYQLAFALQRYDERNGSLPGWLNGSPNGSKVLCSWAIPLLPFIGRSDIHDMWPLLPDSPTIDIFICPSNRPDKRINYPVLHYAGNIGATGTVANDGVFLDVSSGAGKWSLDDIGDADGTATTLAFAEKSSLGFKPHSWTYAPASTPQGSLFGSGTAVPAVFGAPSPPGPFYPVITGTNSRLLLTSGTIDGRPFAPSSQHGGGVVVAFCDGHTAFLRDDPKSLDDKSRLDAYEYGQLLTPRSRWQNNVNKTNSPAMQPWLLKNNLPYLLDEKILKQ